MPVTDGDALVEDILALERRLLDPGVRSSAPEVRRLLAPGFREIGASGTVWDREAIVAALAAEAGGPTRLSEVAAPLVSDEAVLLVYRAESSGRSSWRSSLWVREDGCWRVVFHQGTPVADQGGASAPVI